MIRISKFNFSKSLYAYLFALTVVALCTLVGFILYAYVNSSNLIMLYLLGVVVVATWAGELRGPSITAALLSTLTFDFFFVPPYFSFAVTDIQYFLTLLVMLVITQVICQLTSHIRRHTEAVKKAKLQTETERFRNTLLSSISHDLRTPLTAIMGSASSLMQTNHLDNEASKELIQNIYEESERLNHLVNNVLQTIRIESGCVHISKQLYPLEEIIGSALNRLEKLLKLRTLDIYLPQPSPLVRLDHLLIEQVLINLIENALKFSPMHSPIEISAEVKDKNVMVKVSDHGEGLHLNDIDKIFDKFYQGKRLKKSSTLKVSKGGVGLGLAICKDIINIHGGEIWAENRHNGGATFCFTLPLG